MPADFHFFPFDDGPGEDSMENRWEAMMQYMRTTGILIPWDQSSLDPSTGDLAITANGGLSVQSAVGEAWIHGFMFQQQDDYYSITISPNSSGDDRIDLVTARLDTDANTIVIHVEEGTPSMSPVAPTPVESDPIWDLPLAEVYVEDSAVTILPDDITDLRVVSTQAAGGSSSVTLSSAGGDETLIADSNAPPSLVTKGLTAGSNISFLSDADSVTITGANAPTDAPICILARTSNLAVTDATSSNITWESAIFNPNGLWDAMTNPDRITISEEGFYLYNVLVRWLGHASASGTVITTVNRTTTPSSTTAQATARVRINSADQYSCNVSFMSYMNVNDYFTVSATNTSGQTLSILGASPLTRISVQKIRGV